MKVEFISGVESLYCNKIKTKEPVKGSGGLLPLKTDCLSFMSIPRLAFLGRLVIPQLPEGLRAQPDPVISIASQPKFEMAEKVKCLVYPQDPLVSDLSLYTLNSKVLKGPESDRVRSVDENDEKPVLPDVDGNFIKKTGSAEFDRVNSFQFTQKVLNMCEDILGRKINWAFANPRLKVHARGGVDTNAYYDRWNQQTRFFYFKNRFDSKEMVYTSRMADVVTHETGHAVLDGLRPSYNGWGVYGGAIHEGWSDTIAMLVAMANEDIIDEVIEKTKGDLSKENLIASIGEQFGKAYFGDRAYLRNAINDLKLSDYDSGRESKQVHNFGRLFLGFNYDLIKLMVDKKSEEMPLKQAMIETQKDMSRLLIRAVGDFSPPGNVNYGDVAISMLAADDYLFDGKYKDVLKEAILSRELLKPAEIEYWEREHGKQPGIKINADDMKTRRTITDFINRHKGALKLSSQSNYRVESAYNNAFGETFIQLKGPRRIAVQNNYINSLPEKKKYEISLYDGLTLGFDRSGKLFYKFENKTNNFEVADALKDVEKELLKFKVNSQKAPVIDSNIYMVLGKTNELIKRPRFEEPVS